MKADDKGVILTSDLSLIDDTKITHDEQRIQQVLLNLQSNALKFTEHGKVEIKGRVYQENFDEYLEISVVDTGIGIKKEEQNNLFKMFGYISNDN